MSGWVWWAIGTFGLAGTALIVAGFVVGWPVLLGTKAGKIAIFIGALAAALGAVFLKGKAAGRAAERARLKKVTEKEVGLSAKERQRIDALPDAKVDEELARWDRK